MQKTTNLTSIVRGHKLTKVPIHIGGELYMVTSPDSHKTRVYRVDGQKETPVHDQYERAMVLREFNQEPISDQELEFLFRDLTSYQ